MSCILVYEAGADDWEVWIGRENEDPIEAPGGICIGQARSRDEAVAQAVANLEMVVAELQGPPLPPGTPDPRD